MSKSVYVCGSWFRIIETCSLLCDWMTALISPGINKVYCYCYCVVCNFTISAFGRGMHCTEWIKDTAVKIYHCSLSVLESVKSYLPALSEMWGWLLTRASLCMITSVQQLGLATFTSTLWQQNKENSTAVPLMPSQLVYCNSFLYVGYHSSRTTPPSACSKHCSKNNDLHKKDRPYGACLERTSLAACQRAFQLQSVVCGMQLF